MDELFDETLHEIETLTTAIPYLYVLYAEGTHWIKIGHAVDVPFRMQQLQGGNPLPLRLLFAMQRPDAGHVEELLHANLASYRLQGEWFALPENVPSVLNILGFIIQQSQEEVGTHGVRQRPQSRLPLLEAQILEALEEQPFKIGHLMRRFGLRPGDYGYIRKLMSRLYADGKIEKTRYGIYCSKDYEVKRRI